MRTTIRILSALGCALVSAPNLSLAQSADGADAAPKVRGEGASYEVEFLDDPMWALGPDTLIPRLSVRAGVPMAGLLRPRTSFVPELLKSAETF
jgi:hypothetical protein